MFAQKLSRGAGTCANIDTLRHQPYIRKRRRRMSGQWLDRTTLSVTGPAWTGKTFTDADACAMWAQLPQELQEIALAEIAAGNHPRNILRNGMRGIVVL